MLQSVLNSEISKFNPMVTVDNILRYLYELGNFYGKSETFNEDEFIQFKKIHLLKTLAFVEQGQTL